MKKIAFLYIIIAGISWGTSGIFFNLLEPYGFSPLQMTAMRGGVATVTMSVYLLIHNKKLFKVTLKEFMIFACSGLSVFGTATCYFASIQESSVSTAVILMYTAPVFIMVYSVSFLGEKFNIPKIISMIFMIVGCALVSGICGGMTLNFWGVLFGLCSGICYSAYNIFTKIEMMNKSNSLSATVYCFIVMGIAAICSCNPVQLATLTMQEPTVIVPLILGIGIITCVLPYFFYTLALRDIPVGTASALSIIEPMSATIFSVVFLGENLAITSVCGIVLILTAVFMLGRSES